MMSTGVAATVPRLDLSKVKKVQTERFGQAFVFDSKNLSISVRSSIDKGAETREERDKRRWNMYAENCYRLYDEENVPSTR